MSSGPPLSAHRDYSISTLQRPHNYVSHHEELPDEKNDTPSQSKSDKVEHRLEWEPDDPENPRNWRTAYKGWLTFQLGMLALASSLGSSIISPANKAISEYTHVSPQVATLSLSLYVLGFAFGPMLWGPIGEVLFTSPRGLISHCRLMK